MLAVQRYWFERGLVEYAQAVELERLEPFIDVLAERYQLDNSWAFIQGSKQWPMEYSRFTRGGRHRRRERMAWPPAPSARLTERTRRAALDDQIPFPPSRRALWNRISLVDENNQWVAGRLPQSQQSVRQEIVIDDVVVGFLQLTSPTALSDELAVAFNQQQVKAAVWAVVIALVGTALAAAVLANSFGSPIRALARGTHDLTGGRYGTRIDSTRNDELGLLAQDFNQLSATLKQAQQARQQWVADISHELRTPVAVLQAELETLEDGLRPFDSDAVKSLSGEVARLRLLIEDLNQLARTDSGALSLNLEPVNLAQLFQNTVERFADRAAENGLTVSQDLEALPIIRGDVNRLTQLTANLMENALRYTDQGGCIEILGAVENDCIALTMQDSAPGVPDEALPKLFDRLYRVDPSRNRETGASGLGLAICESIVAAHGGSITAHHSPLGGLRIVVGLPLNRETS